MRFALLAAVTACVLQSCSPGSAGAGAPGIDAGPLASSPALAGAPAGLLYSSSRALYSAGRAITPNVATLANGSGVTFSIQPALPAGLQLDPATGEIAGTPFSSVPTRRHVVTATNPMGAAQFALYVTVLDFQQQLDPAARGDAASLHLTQFAWGRLVEVWDRDTTTGASARRARDLVIDENVQSNAERLVETNAVTGAQRVILLHRFGTPEFAAAFDQLEPGLVAIPDSGILAPPPFAVVPRNAALVLEFDDLLDSATVNGSTIELFTGTPATTPFSARVFADRNHGNVADRNGDRVYEFYTTRAIVDLTVSELDAVLTNPPLPVNVAGLPAATSVNQANVLLRLATRIDLPSGQTNALANLSGAHVSFVGNGSNDGSSPSQDIVRAFRSGGSATNDAYNGNLLDTEGPLVVGRQPGAIVAISPLPALGPDGYVLDFSYTCVDCARASKRGDVLIEGGTYLEVDTASGNAINGLVSAVRVRRVAGPAPAGGAAEIASTFIAANDASRAACYLTFTPSAGLPPGKQLTTGVQVSATFSEPIDVASVSPLESFVLRRPQTPVEDGYGIVVSEVSNSVDARTFTLTPLVPLTHAVTIAEPYLARITNRVRDSAGNALASAMTGAALEIDPTEAGQRTFGFALTFDSPDNLAGIAGQGLLGVGLPEVRGQFLLDFASSSLRPRPVTHFSAIADRTQAVPALMVPFAPGTQTPLSRLGSKLQTIWRYCDVGLALQDESTTNVDVEGLDWAPVGGGVLADQYAHFAMSLCHGARLPDESLDPNLLPAYPNSGLVSTYSQNQLDPVGDPLRQVFPRPGGPQGYNISPADAFIGASGTKFVPWPMNRNTPSDQKIYYTWRDTALQAKGGANGSGAELPIVAIAGGTTPQPPLYPAGEVPTIGLPLLMEFRCYPDNGALGLNAFDVSLAAASSARPNFRAFSTGGVNTSGQVIVKNPDAEAVATGGFNPGSIPPGAATLPVENTFYLGQMDLVVRVSRAHTIWFDLSSTATAFAPPVVFPRASEQPAGTQIQLSFRGAIVLSNVASLLDAQRLDAYGEKDATVTGPPPVFFNNDNTWKSNLASLNGTRFFQARITFVSNAATNATPRLDAVGFAYRN
jgi:hypothetical protein